MTKAKKKELKAKFFKVLHIVCYIFSALFLIIMLVTGIKSCGSVKKQTQVNQVAGLLPQKALNNGEQYYQYRLRFNQGSYFDLSIREQALLSNNTIDLYNAVTDDAPDLTYTIYNSYDNFGVYLSYSDNYFNIDGEIRAVYRAFVDRYDDYYYRLYYIEFESNEDYIFERENLTSDEDDNSYEVLDNGYEIVSSVPITAVGFDNLYAPIRTYNVSFNSQINYYGLFGANLKSQVIKTTLLNNKVTLNLPTFVTNNTLYNGIELDFANAKCDLSVGEPMFRQTDDAVMLVGDDESGLYYHNQCNIIRDGYLYYTEMYYLGIDGSRTKVNVRDYTLENCYIEGLGAVNVALPSSTWLNQTYRNITFLNALTDSQANQLSAFNVLNYTEIQLYSDNITIFTLMGDAFGSVASIFGIMLLPGISIGTLIFLPLVVTLILVIVKLLHK